MTKTKLTNRLIKPWAELDYSRLIYQHITVDPEEGAQYHQYKQGDITDLKVVTEQGNKYLVINCINSEHGFNNNIEIPIEHIKEVSTHSNCITIVLNFDKEFIISFF